MFEQFHFQFTNPIGQRITTAKFVRGTEGLTDLGVRTMVVEYEKMGMKNIQVFLDDQNVTPRFRLTKEEKHFSNTSSLLNYQKECFVRDEECSL